MAARNVAVSGQVAVRVQAPDPLVMVTVAVAGLVPMTGPTVHTAVEVMTGAMPASVVAVTVKLVPKAAVVGAPVNVTVGGSLTQAGPAQAVLENAEDIGVVWKAPDPNASGDCGVKSSTA